MERELGTDKMKIKINDIPAEGVTVSEDVDAKAMGLDTQELKFAGPVQVAAAFSRERDTVLVDVAVKGATEQICGRCLEAYTQPYEDQFYLDYEVREDPVLDITDDVRQEILLSYPVLFLCKEECKGLCPKCGTNLNERSCEHASS